MSNEYKLRAEGNLRASDEWCGGPDADYARAQVYATQAVAEALLHLAAVSKPRDPRPARMVAPR